MATATKTRQPRLKVLYRDRVVKALKEEFGYKSIMEVPRLEKIVVTMVTLRGDYMYEFFDRLVNVAIPRVKDFRGTNPNAFDGHGNYSLGVTEQIIFPEIDYDKIERVTGLNIAIVTTAKTDREAGSLLAHLGMPFRK
jgi:large subunit ribosomal protein L5